MHNMTKNKIKTESKKNPNTIPPNPLEKVQEKKKSVKPQLYIIQDLGKIKLQNKLQLKYYLILNTLGIKLSNFH